MNEALVNLTPKRPIAPRRLWLAAIPVLLVACINGAWLWLYATGCGEYSSVNTRLELISVLSTLAFALLGGLILVYRGDNRIGWLSLWIGFGHAIMLFILMYGECGAAGQLQSPALPYLAWFLYSFSDFMVIVPLFILLPSLFPDGRFVSGRWQSATAAGLAILFVARIAMALLPDLRQDNAYDGKFDLDNPFGLATLPEWWYPFFRTTSLLVACALCFLAIAAMIVRLRRARGDERQQVKWLAYFLATAVLVQIVVFEIPGGLFYPQIFRTIWYDLSIFITLTGFPTVIGLAIFRYRLYDIDLIINRTVVYGLLTALVVALYALIVSGLSVIVHDANNLAASLLATGVIAVAFQPLRAGLQSAANRWLFGERDNPANVLTQLTDHLEAGADSGASLLSNLVTSVAVSLKLPYVALQLRQGGGIFELAAETGQRPDHVEVLPLQHRQQTIGQLVVAPRSPGEAFSSADESLLVAITRLAATTVRTIQLTDEVQAARVRTVAAREEERRRLRRDLHDGLGPVLAGQGLKLAAARQLLRQRPGDAERLLDEVVGQSEKLVDEVRRLVYALRPPTLDELGLVEAIQEHVDTVAAAASVRIRVDAPPVLPELPAAIEVAAFRIVQEALNNVIRHAQARHCTVTLTVDTLAVDGALQVCVQDDGVGLPTQTRSGVGLLSMRERAAEVGGTCKIGPGVGGLNGNGTGEQTGVVVRLALPLAS